MMMLMNRVTLGRRRLILTCVCTHFVLPTAKQRSYLLAYLPNCSITALNVHSQSKLIYQWCLLHSLPQVVERQRSSTRSPVLPLPIQLRRPVARAQSSLARATTATSSITRPRIPREPTGSGVVALTISGSALNSHGTLWTRANGDGTTERRWICTTMRLDEWWVIDWTLLELKVFWGGGEEQLELCKWPKIRDWF